MSDELHELTLGEAAAAIARRTLSPVELTAALLRRIEALDDQLDAFVTLTPERALAQARAAEAQIARGGLLGPLHGIPYALKDVYDTAGILTAGHSRIYARRVPAADATTHERLQGAGAVLLGKLATHELAHGGPSFDLAWPPARNPWQPEHYSGGSSSGPGAAVAAGLVPAALGSDTGGSIRTPALLCGIVGLKPTMGLVSRHGVMQNSPSFDCCGPMTRTVQDCALVLQAIAGRDARDRTTAADPVPDYRAALTGDIRGLRIGVLRHFWEEDLPVHPELARAMEEAIGVLRGLGAAVDVARMRPVQAYYDVKLVLAETEIFSVYQHELARRCEDFGADFLWKILPACLFQAAEYVQAQRLRRELVLEMQPLYQRFDVLLAAGAGPAPRLDAYRPIAFWQKPINMATPFNVTGGPALALCNGFSATGLPLGMQVAGRPFDEVTVLRVAHAYERATGWHRRRPVLVAGRPQVPVVPHDERADWSSPQPALASAVERLARRAGLDLGEAAMARLQAAAPYALEMSGRIVRRRAWWDEPAAVLRVTGRGAAR